MVQSVSDQSFVYFDHKELSIDNVPSPFFRFRVDIVCESPNKNLYDFNGNIRVNTGAHDVGALAPLSHSALLLRGARLMNTQWIYGAVVYTGHETKLLMNSNKAPLKRSNIDRITNHQILFLFAILVGISFASATGRQIMNSKGLRLTYVNPDNSGSNFFSDFLTFFILYNNLIPISLQVTLEIVKFIQAYFINWDAKMYHAETDTYATARTSNLNEELGQIKYVFSDKTGTLTQNVMVYKAASIAGLR